jgi:hypothetical protein
VGRSTRDARIVTNYLGLGDEIVLFRKKGGGAVHVQCGTVNKDELGKTPQQEQLAGASESMIGWVVYERRLGVCGAWSVNGVNDPNRGSVVWCEDSRLCRPCMDRLSEEERHLVFMELTSRAVCDD